MQLNALNRVTFGTTIAESDSSLMGPALLQMAEGVI